MWHSDKGIIELKGHCFIVDTPRFELIEEIEAKNARIRQ